MGAQGGQIPAWGGFSDGGVILSEGRTVKLAIVGRNSEGRTLYSIDGGDPECIYRAHELDELLREGAVGEPYE